MDCEKFNEFRTSLRFGKIVRNVNLKPLTILTIRFILDGGHPLSTHAKFSEKLTFLTP